MDYSKVLVATGDLNEDYEIIDVIFALDSSTEKFFSSADPNQAFANVKDKLRQKCAELGGQAVINCEFEHRVASTTSAFGNAKQVVEIFAYGTAVRLK